MTPHPFFFRSFVRSLVQNSENMTIDDLGTFSVRETPTRSGSSSSEIGAMDSASLVARIAVPADIVLLEEKTQQNFTSE